MSVVRKIFNRINVLLVTFSDADSFSVSVLQYRNSKLSAKYEDLNASAYADILKEQIPIAVLLKGYGVITKNCETNKDIIAKVTAEQSHFLWNFDYKGHILFIRTEQVDKALGKLQKWQDKIIETACVDDNADERAIESLTAQISSDKFSVRHIAAPTLYGSRMAMMLVQKIKLPVLLFILLLLVANTFVSSNISDTYAQSAARLTAIREQRGQLSSIEQQKQQAIAGYSRRMPAKIASLCDRIALITPQQITLTELHVQPLVKSFEAGKELKLHDNKVHISGYASSYASISEYIADLQKEPFIQKLTLASVAQSAKTSLFAFSIYIDLNK